MAQLLIPALLAIGGGALGYIMGLRKSNTENNDTTTANNLTETQIVLPQDTSIKKRQVDSENSNSVQMSCFNKSGQISISDLSIGKHRSTPMVLHSKEFDQPPKTLSFVQELKLKVMRFRRSEY